MKLKLTLKQPGDSSTRNVQVQADVTATVADVARRLCSTGAPHLMSTDQPVTLRAEFPGHTGSRLLNPLIPVNESSLRSGCTIEVVLVNDRRAEDDINGAPVGTVRVISGPDAGREFELTAGMNFVGRDPENQIFLCDGLVSRRHATITVADTVQVADHNSANGLTVNGALCARATITTASRIGVGDTELQWIPRETGSPTSAVPLESPEVAHFSRSPRVEAAYRGATFVAPEPPTTERDERFPTLAVVAPIVMGGALYAYTQQPYSLLFIAVSPAIVLGAWLDSRVRNRRHQRRTRSRFRASIAEVRSAFVERQREEAAARLTESPSAEVAAAAMHDRTALLWTRKPEHATFLEVRFGTGQLASRHSISLPPRGSADHEDWRALTNLAEEFSTVEGVPVVESLDRAGALGIAGTAPVANNVARSIVIQLAGLHSPADLVITAFGGSDTPADWSWLSWLPHVDSPHTPLRVCGLAGDFASATALVSELEELIAIRRSSRGILSNRVRSPLNDRPVAARHDPRTNPLSPLPAIVVLVVDDSPADRARLVAIGEDGPDVGVFLIWLARAVEALPVVCRTFIDLDEIMGRGQVGFVREGSNVELDSIDLIDATSALDAARALAPVSDSGALVLDESDLPHSVAFLDLFEEDLATDREAIAQRWTKNDSVIARWRPGTQREPGGIRALVGQSPTEPFFLDLRQHGPHALVGGTTGSGKSAFLQTWIMGIAAEYSPDRVTFLLVDYKGGAAFAECVDLPHTVGLVTDLTPHLVRRALTSLRAELAYRERILADKGAKDIESLERRSDPDTPPALVIVIDEFAALAADVPEFIDGIVDVAGRGRSLGLHLIMATQRPAGVIRDSLRSNTNLRVALRVADEADSLDVLGVTSAAFFDPGTPGRAAAKLGPGRVIDFQSASLGVSARNRPTPADIHVSDLRFGHGSQWVKPTRDDGKIDDDSRDIQRIATTIAYAADDLHLNVPRKPWLDQLPSTHDLERHFTETDEQLTIGLRDEPEAQRQEPFAISFDADGNVAIFGTSGSGKSTALRTVAVAASQTADTHPVQIYGLDFSGGGLASIESLPTVGSIIAGSDTERVARLVHLISDEAAERTKRYSAAHAATLTEYRAITGESGEPRMVVLLDGFAAFRTEYEWFETGALFATFAKLMAIGRQVGIHFVVSADRLSAVPSALLANVQVRVALRMANAAEHAALGVLEETVADAEPGRGVHGTHEIQLSVPGGSRDLAMQAAAIRQLGDELHSNGVGQVPRIERLPDLIPASSLPPVVAGLPTLGVSDDSLAPVGVPLDGLFVVTGPFGSGRTTAVTTIVHAVRAARPELAPYLIVARRSGLATITDWSGTSADADEAEHLAVRLTGELELPLDERDTDRLIVIENVGDFEGFPAEHAVVSLLKAARRAAIPVIVEADTVTAARAWSIFSELKTARAGLVLQPDESDGSALFRVQFPRVTRADFPVGRGILVIHGMMTRVQVAYPHGTEGRRRDTIIIAR